MAIVSRSIEKGNTQPAGQLNANACIWGRQIAHRMMMAIQGISAKYPQCPLTANTNCLC